MGKILLTPEQMKEKIDNDCDKRIREMRDKGYDPICVEASISYQGKNKKIKLRLLPIIITTERFKQFVNAYGGEYMYDPTDNVHRRIFWFKPHSGCKTIDDLFKANIDEVFASFNKLDNRKLDLSNEGGILVV